MEKRKWKLLYGILRLYGDHGKENGNFWESGEGLIVSAGNTTQFERLEAWRPSGKASPCGVGIRG